MGQLGLVPSNYLLELSQFLTQDVGAKNGAAPEAPASNGAPRPVNNGWVKINNDEMILTVKYFQD